MVLSSLNLAYSHLLSPKLIVIFLYTLLYVLLRHCYRARPTSSVIMHPTYFTLLASVISFWDRREALDSLQEILFIFGSATPWSCTQTCFNRHPTATLWDIWLDCSKLWTWTYLTWVCHEASLDDTALQLPEMSPLPTPDQMVWYCTRVSPPF